MTSASASDTGEGSARGGHAGPLVTVIIPTFNRSRWLLESIPAVLGQTYENFRLLISDNASEDDTREVVRSFDDPRVAYVRRPSNIGLLANYNAAVASVDTPFVWILPDDDRPYPTFLERTVEVLEGHPSVGVVCAAYDEIDEAGTVIAERISGGRASVTGGLEPGRDFIQRALKEHMPINGPAALSRAPALIATGLFHDEDFPAPDMAMWLRLALRWDAYFLAEPLICFRVHETSDGLSLLEPDATRLVQPDGYPTRMLEIKLRFIAANADVLDDTGGLRRLAHLSRRTMLVEWMQRLVLGSSMRRSELLRMLKSALRAEPALCLDWRIWRLVGVAAAGPERIRSFVRNEPSARSH